MSQKERIWTPESIRHSILFRRYGFGKLPTQIADEAGLPVERITDVVAGRAVSPAVRARLIGYLSTPAGPTALRQNYNRTKKNNEKRGLIIRKLKMLCAIGKRYRYAPRLGAAMSLNNGELMCYAYAIEDNLKRRILACYPESRLNYWDSAPVWKWIEHLERGGGKKIDPRPSPCPGPPGGLRKDFSPRPDQSFFRQGG